MVLAELVTWFDDLSNSGLDAVLSHRKGVAVAVKCVLFHACSVESQLSVLDLALLLMKSNPRFVLFVSVNDVAHLPLNPILMLLSLLLFLWQGVRNLSACKGHDLELGFNLLLNL